MGFHCGWSARSSSGAGWLGERRGCRCGGPAERRLVAGQPPAWVDARTCERSVLLLASTPWCRRRHDHGAHRKGDHLAGHEAAVGDHPGPLCDSHRSSSQPATAAEQLGNPQAGAIRPPKAGADQAGADQTRADQAGADKTRADQTGGLPGARMRCADLR